MLGPILLTWVLLGTVTTYRCQGADCRAVRQIPAQRLSVFPTPDACEGYRAALAHQQLPEVYSQAPSDVRIKKEIVYTCKEEGEGL